MLTEKELTDIRQHDEEILPTGQIRGNLLGGYNKKAVDEYILELNERLTKAQTVFKEKTDEYRERINELGRDKSIMAEKIARYDAVNIQLQEALRTIDVLSEKNMSLQKQADARKEDAIKQMEQYTEESERRITAEHALADSNEMIEQLKNRLEKERQNTEIAEQLMERTNAENAEIKKRMNDTYAELSAKNTRLAAMYAESAANHASVTGRLRISCADMLRRLEEVTDDLNRLSKNAAADICEDSALEVEKSKNINGKLQASA